MKNVIDLDDYLNDDEDEKTIGKRPGKKEAVNPDLIRNEQAGIGRIRVKDIKVKSLEDDESISSPNIALNRHANEKMNKYLKRAPQYKILEKQKELLKEEIGLYKKAGNFEFLEKAKSLLKELEVEKQKFIKFFKRDNVSKEDKIMTEDKVKSSVKLKELKQKVKELKKEYSNNNPNSLLRRLKELKEAIDAKTTFSDSGELEDIDSIYDEEIDEQSLTSGSIVTEYNEICERIANIIDVSVNEVMEMKFGPLLIELKKYCPDTTPLKDEIQLVQMEASAELKKIKGGNDITDVIFEIF